MACRYDPSPQEIEAERKRINLAFKISCKAMRLLHDNDSHTFYKSFNKEEIEWYEQHLKDDIEREKREKEAKKAELEYTEKQITELQNKLKTLKGK